MKTLLALVERGLKVEIRFLPPAPQEGAEKDQEATVPPEFAELEKIVPQLVFPRVEETPALDLPPPPESEVTAAEAKAKSKDKTAADKSVVKKRPKT